MVKIRRERVACGYNDRRLSGRCRPFDTRCSWVAFVKKILWEHKGDKISLSFNYFRKGTKSIDQVNCVLLWNRWCFTVWDEQDYFMTLEGTGKELSFTAYSEIIRRQTLVSLTQVNRRQTHQPEGTKKCGLKFSDHITRMCITICLGAGQLDVLECRKY